MGQRSKAPEHCRWTLMVVQTKRNNILPLSCHSAETKELYSFLQIVVTRSVAIVQWENEWIPLSVLPVTRVQFWAGTEHFKRSFCCWSHSANPSWANVAENSSISPQWHHTACGQQRGRPKFNYKQWLKKVVTYLQTAPCLLSAGLTGCSFLNSGIYKIPAESPG